MVKPRSNLWYGSEAFELYTVLPNYSKTRAIYSHVRHPLRTWEGPASFHLPGTVLEG